ncbi:hypothetical protein QYS49_12645 [Marivirga salinae]|uniref:Uncharacterized protein n=1 Tax=Marivirga salinarum TaxID=3059078 RepID=A0AA49GFC8_9BACT|nr:hypothetical protein [Marivirga sp. BDSF4-3]WKK77846.2 hypothetical protein QYS49_12645 [Marivirga sp. BDSF4-3]
MKEPNVLVKLEKDDFELSDQVSASAKTIRFLGIDFQRIFMKRTGSINNTSNVLNINYASIPVIGKVLTDKASSYALYELMYQNEGYDVIFYPQYEIKTTKPFLGLGFILNITEVKTKARLGKLK